MLLTARPKDLSRNVTLVGHSSVPQVSCNPCDPRGYDAGLYHSPLERTRAV